MFCSLGIRKSISANALIRSLLTSVTAHLMRFSLRTTDPQTGTLSAVRSFQKRYPAHIFPIFLNKNTGTTYPRNLALKRATGKYVIVMDSDVEVHQGTITALIKTLDMDHRMGLAVPKLLYPNGNLQKSVDVFPTVFTKFFRYFFLKAIEKKENKVLQETELREVDYAISAMWVMKGEVLETVGLLDENIFYSPEDVDYCLRLWRAGYKIIYNPLVSVIHDTQEISRGFKVGAATFSHIKGLAYYFKKHGYFLRRPAIK